MTTVDARNSGGETAALRALTCSVPVVLLVRIATAAHRRAWPNKLSAVREHDAQEFTKIF